MQDRALASLRPRRAHPSPSACVLALAVAAAGLACTQKGPLSDEEMAQLRAFMLPAGPPARSVERVRGQSGARPRWERSSTSRRAYAGELLGALQRRREGNGALGTAGDDGQGVRARPATIPPPAARTTVRRPNATSLGAGYTRRNAPTVINAAYSPLWQFWDGRADSLWSQALAPPEGIARVQRQPAAGRSRPVRQLPGRRPGSCSARNRSPTASRAFPRTERRGTTRTRRRHARRTIRASHSMTPTTASITTTETIVNRIYANFGKAIAAYERRLVSNNFEPSPFDRFMAGDEEAMSPAAIRGARLFIGHAGCAECHRGPMFTRLTPSTTSARPQTGEYVPATDTGRFDGIGTLTDRSRTSSSSTGRASSATHQDTAYLARAGGDDGSHESATGQFKTPTLRNVSKTAPYMHDGAYQTLWDVVNHYNFGGATGQLRGREGSGDRAPDADGRGARRSRRVPRGARGRRAESVCRQTLLTDALMRLSLF